MKAELSLWVLVGAAVLHVVEEYALDWRAWAESLSGVALQWNQFFFANAAFLVFAAVAAWCGWRRPVLALSFPALTSINGLVFHIGPTLVTGRLSPGAITATFLYLPVGIWVYVRATRSGVLTRRVVLLSTALGAGIMALPLVAFASR